MCQLIDALINTLIDTITCSLTHISKDATTHSHTFPHEAHRYGLTHLNAYHHTHMCKRTLKCTHPHTGLFPGSWV